MKNILKSSLLMTILIIAFLLLGGTNVNAASSVSFKEDIDYKEGADITVFDIGTVSYQSTTSSSRNPTKSFRIKNNTAEEISLSTIDFTDPFTPFEIVGTPARKIDGNDSIQITIQVKKGTNATAPNTITNTLAFYVNDTESITVDVEAIIDKAEIPSKPRILRQYTYNGQEQTFYFEGYIPEYMNIEGDLTGTDAGDYSVTIKFDENQGKNYKWGDGTSDDVTINFSMNKADPASPTYTQKAVTGVKLSTVVLPEGWTWDDPDTHIEVGDKLYLASYVDTTGNYNDVANIGLNVTGINQYTVTIPANTNFTSTPTTDFEMFEGESKTVSLVAQSGYLFTSIKLNGTEMITNKLDSYDLKIENIDKNVDITVETERIVITPENEGEIPKFIIGSKDSIKFKFGYDFDVFNINAFRINGKTISMEDIDKYFRFTEGSVVIEITNEYLATLEPGTYNLELDLELGELMKASFLVEEELKTENPETGDNIILYIILSVVSIIGIAGIVIIRKKKESK